MAANALLAKLTGGTLSSLGGLAGAANQMPCWTGAGVMATTALTAAARGLLDDGDVATMRATPGLGDAATKTVTGSSTDTTAGRVVKVGDFGLGNASLIVTDFDAITATGLYRNNAAATGAPESGTLFWNVLHIGHNADATAATQIVTRAAGTAKNQVHVSRKSPGVWAPWSAVCHQDSAVGTVSQASGVITGAMIERGANANGHYVSALPTARSSAGASWRQAAARRRHGLSRRSSLSCPPSMEPPRQRCFRPSASTRCRRRLRHLQRPRWLGPPCRYMPHVRHRALVLTEEAMIITLSPMRRDDRLELSVAGAVLTLNGSAIDLAGYDHAAAPNRWIAEQPSQEGGEWRVTVILPFGPLPPDHDPDAPAIRAVLFPEPVTVTEDGPVDLPALPTPVAQEAEGGI